MAESKNDVIAGIGDIQTEVNVIYPYFDATIRKFIVGKNCILTGLEFDKQSLTLTAGYCMAEGFVGHLLNSKTFETQPKKIYGRFIVNHAGTYTKEADLDRFEVVADPSEGSIKQDKIIDTKGEYWLLLYEDGERKVDNNYPEHAKYASNLTDTISPEAIVTGAIKNGDTSDKTVATTEFVQRVVNEQIGYKTVTIGYYDLYKPQLGGEVRIDIGEIKLEKKDDFIIATPTRTNTAEYDYEIFSEGGGTHTLSVDSIPSEFISNNDVAFLPVYYIVKDNISSGGRNVSHYEFVKVGNGNIAGIKSGWKINR